MTATMPSNVRNMAVAASHQSIVFALSSNSSRLSSLNRFLISTSTTAGIAGLAGGGVCADVSLLVRSVGLVLPTDALAAAGARSMAGSVVCAYAIIGKAAAIAAATSPVPTPAFNNLIIPLSRSICCSCAPHIYPQFVGNEFRQQRGVFDGGFGETTVPYSS